MPTRIKRERASSKSLCLGMHPSGASGVSGRGADEESSEKSIHMGMSVGARGMEAGGDGGNGRMVERREEKAQVQAKCNPLPGPSGSCCSHVQRGYVRGNTEFVKSKHLMGDVRSACLSAGHYNH